MAESSIVCGLVVIDGSKAYFGRAAENHNRFVHVAGHVTNLAMSRTRRGGSSAARYARKRDGAELGFLRRVAEKMNESLPDAEAFIVGGKGDMKYKLMKEMQASLRSKVQMVVPYSGDSDEAALRYLGSRCQAVRRQVHLVDCTMCLNEFRSRYERVGDCLCCWGVSQTIAALRMDAVHCLLLADDGVTNSGNLEDLARASGASVFHISSDTEAGALFCKGFGVGGLLRWAQDVDDFECESSSEDDAPESSERPCGGSEDAASEVSTVDTEDSWAQTASTWLASRLSCSLGDVSSAEALAAGVEVLLACDIEAVEDRIIAAVELLREQGIEETLLQEFAIELSISYD